mgnify:CR=1 FL=1
MMTVETLIIKLGVNPKEISKAEIILLTSLVERYNHGYMRRSIYFSYEEVLIKEAEGIIHGYLPEIDGKRQGLDMRWMTISKMNKYDNSRVQERRN